MSKYFHHEWDPDHKGYQGKFGCTSICKKCGKILVMVCIGNHPYSPWKTCKFGIIPPDKI